MGIDPYGRSTKYFYGVSRAPLFNAAPGKRAGPSGHHSEITTHPSGSRQRQNQVPLRVYLVF